MRAVPGPIVLLLGSCLLALTVPAMAQAPPAPAAAVTVEVAAETDADLSQYSARLRDLVSRYANAASAPSATGEARVRFRIRRDGAAQKPILSLSSGKPSLDEAALAAVSEALHHAEPLPATVTGTGLDFQARFIFGSTAQAEEKPASLADVARQRAARKKQEADAAAKKVYTNETVSGSDASARSNPRSRSDQGSDDETKPSSTTKSKSTSAGTSETPKRQEEDPEYYRRRLDPLKSELQEVKNELNRIRYAPAERTAGLNTISNTQKNEIERLERKQADLEKRIAAIEAEAARNNVSLY